MSDYGWQVRAVNMAENGEKKAKRLLGDHIGTVMLAVLFLLQILVPLVSAGVRNPFTPAYLFSTLCSLFSTLFGYYLFVPNGRRDLLALPESQMTLKAWQVESDRVRETGKLTRFRAYCRERAEQEAEAAREAALLALENAGVDRAAYAAVWRGKGRFALRRARRRGQLTREQVRCLLRIRPVPVLPIPPNLVLSWGGEERFEAALRSNAPYLRRAMVSKPVICVLSVLAQSFFYPDLRENTDIIVLLCGIAVRVFCVCCAALSGYRTGVRAARCYLNDARCRTAFLCEFSEQEKKEA